MPQTSRSLPLMPLALLVALVLPCLTALGCGGGTSREKAKSAQGANASDSSPANSHDAAVEEGTPPGADDQVIAKIDNSKITKAALVHRMTIGATNKNEVPVPPDYSACIAHLQAQRSSTTAPSNSTGASGLQSAPAGSTKAQLRRACAKKYKALLRTALASLINEAWLTNEAGEDGIMVDEAEFARELKASTAQFEKLGGLQLLLGKSGRTVTDLKQELRIGQLSSKIYQRIEGKIPPLSDGLVSRYYVAHKHDYLLPIRRDLHIVRTESAAAAAHAKQELRAGRSFADIANDLKVAQPFSAKNGLVLDLTPNLYAESVLANAIFKAPKGVLTGPIKIPLGYYIFEVTRIIPSHQLTLSQATPQIKQRLPEMLHNKTLAASVQSFKRRWTSRTDCQPGYVVEGCRQFRPSKTTPPGDPYVL